MSMQVTTSYDKFVATVKVTCDSIDEIDLTSSKFRIDVTDQLFAASKSDDMYQALMDKEAATKTAESSTYNYTDYWGTLHSGITLTEFDALLDTWTQNYVETHDQGWLNGVQHARSYRKNTIYGQVNTYENSIQSLLTIMNTPLLTIDKNNVDTFVNSDDESLLKNGVQLVVGMDKKSMLFRFIPNSMTYKFQSVIVTCGFDEDNVTKFDINLMPRLISGTLEKAPAGKSSYGTQYSTDDPILGSGAYITSSYDPITEVTTYSSTSGEYPRPDYQFNDETDIDNMYVNNTPSTSSTVTPMWQLKSTAYISDEQITSGYEYDWTLFESSLYDNTSDSSMPLPYTVNGVSSLESVSAMTGTVTLVPTYTGSAYSAVNTMNVNYYEIIQYVETSSTVPTFTQNQIKLTVGI